MALPSHPYLLLISFILPCLQLHHATAQPTAPRAAATPEAEKQLLLQIKRAWDDPASLSSWDDATKHCNWSRVECDGGGYVTSLSLNRANVTGPLPDAVGDLVHLTRLDLYDNSISGSFPVFLYNCTGIQYIDLSQNYLGGKLPADIDRLAKNLTTLLLQGNEFTGEIPKALSRLKNLRQLTLDNNRFVGTIPPELGELTNLEKLTLAYASFDAGVLPESFKNLTKLQFLFVANCSLTGDFPRYVVDMPEMMWLDLSRNAFTGNVPPGIWNLTKLQYLYIYSNNLTGKIVVDGTFGSMSLIEIDMAMNQLSGRIPESFGSLDNLTLLSMFWNNFSGEIPVSIGQLRSLEVLKLFNNRLTGTLPPELGKHSGGLWNIEVDDNDISGTIPDGLCDNRKYRFFTASDNRLNGSIPASLASCPTLQGLQLINNELSGEVPAELWTATKLSIVLLQNNYRLTGSLPQTLYLNLTVLNIQNNLFGGRLPSSAVGLHKINAANNSFSGEIPVELAAGMPLLQELDLSSNQLSGVIPASIATLGGMTQLDLSKNQLSGQIPAKLGTMPVLTALDLSSNRLSGDIPPELGLMKLNKLNLSSNQLIGKIPAGLAISAYEDSFINNPGLCTVAPPSSYLAGVGSCSAGKHSGSLSPALRAVLLSAGAVLLLVIATFAFFIVRDIKKRSRLAPREEDWKLTPFQALDFGEASVLRGLTEENVIGKGGSGRVYRITYTSRDNGSTGAAVAVKRIWSAGKMDKTLEREFESEVNILGNIRHTNIVKLLCCLCSAESKLLVYEYMDNGSLDKWLHGHKLPAGPSMLRSQSVRRAPLHWPTRVRIAVGAAQGLCYMHHECSPPIVHRDVKSSNILLDSELQAKVADFGLARMLVRTGTPDSASAFAGSFGYMAPECAYTRKVNEKVDVYSFGVVLLELTTGREANDGGEHGSLADWAWRHLQSGKSIADATDKYIRDAGYSDEIEVVFKLGIICTGGQPSSRPTMKGVLQILLRCEQTHQKTEEKVAEYEAAPLLQAQRGSRRKQLSDTKVIEDGIGDFDCNV